jgi:hypothetical protein
MADAALTPGLALRYLGELSTDIRAALILDARGQLAASTLAVPSAERMRSLVEQLFERADADQVEVRAPRGCVFAVRDRRWAVAAVTGRFALPSLMFYDLRSVLSDLGAKAA